MVFAVIVQRGTGLSVLGVPPITSLLCFHVPTLAATSLCHVGAWALCAPEIAQCQPRVSRLFHSQYPGLCKVWIHTLGGGKGLLMDVVLAVLSRYCETALYLVSVAAAQSWFTFCHGAALLFLLLDFFPPILTGMLGLCFLLVVTVLAGANRKT